MPETKEDVMRMEKSAVYYKLAKLWSGKDETDENGNGDREEKMALL
jgi:hypothetical protein